MQGGPFITVAGISAGIDLALALVESDYGPSVARRVARWMVVFLQRPGGQAQFSVWAQSAIPVTRGLREVLDCIVSDPTADHSIAAMAARAAVSERHLVRTFRDQVGMTPARFVEQARLEAAKVLLATGDLGQEAVARRAGFGARRAKWVTDHAASDDGSLTEAERRVAYLVAVGHTNKSAAKSLDLSINTVGTHLRSIYAKLGVQSRVQLTNVLRERGEL